MTFEQWWLSQPLDIRKMGPSMSAIEAAFNAGIKAEREACAKVCEATISCASEDALGESYAQGAFDCEQAIRARGETRAPLPDYDDGL